MPSKEKPGPTIMAQSDLTRKCKETVDKREFYNTLKMCLKGKKNDTVSYMTWTKYNSIVRMVKGSKSRKLRKSTEEKRIKKFDVVQVENRERLVEANTASPVIYIAKDELYDVLKEAHLMTEHGGRQRMTSYLKARYKNVTLESVLAFLKLCEACKKKPSPPPPPIPSPPPEPPALLQPIDLSVKVKDHPKPIKKREVPPMEDASTKPITVDVRTKVRVDFVDMSFIHQKDSVYSHIVVYRDVVTKFVQLRPLWQKQPKEIVLILRSIYENFGAPRVILTPELELVQAAVSMSDRPDVAVEPADTDECFDDIFKVITTWLLQRRTENWSGSLRFVQYMTNITYNEEIKKTPFEAMFGRKGKLDVTCLSLPADFLEDIRPDELSHQETEDAEINEVLEVVMDPVEVGQ